MTFQEFDQLNFRAEEAGVGDCPALKRLLCFLQAENVAQKEFNKYLARMHDLEKAHAKTVNDAIERSINGQ